MNYFLRVCCTNQPLGTDFWGKGANAVSFFVRMSFVPVKRRDFTDAAVSNANKYGIYLRRRDYVPVYFLDFRRAVNTWVTLWEWISQCSCFYCTCLHQAAEAPMCEGATVMQRWDTASRRWESHTPCLLLLQRVQMSYIYQKTHQIYIKMCWYCVCEQCDSAKTETKTQPGLKFLNSGIL